MNVIVVVVIGGIIGALDGVGIFFAPGEPFKTEIFLAAILKGILVKSGSAVSILIDGSVRSPHLCETQVIDLSDPRNPETRQPYHAAMGVLETNASKLERRMQSIRRATEKSIVDLLKRYTDNGY